MLKSIDKDVKEINVKSATATITLNSGKNVKMSRVGELVILTENDLRFYYDEAYDKVMDELSSSYNRFFKDDSGNFYPTDSIEKFFIVDHDYFIKTSA